MVLFTLSLSFIILNVDGNNRFISMATISEPYKIIPKLRAPHDRAVYLLYCAVEGSVYFVVIV